MSTLRLLGLGTFVAALLGLVLVTGTSQGQDKERARRTAKAAASTVRQVYAVQGGSAKELANALLPHFRNDSSFQVLPATGNKMLILSGPRELVEEARALLQEIDRPARTVRVDVFLVDMTPKGTGAVELAGPMAKVLAKITELQQQGMIASVQRIELSVLERDRALYHSGDSRPYVTGISSARGFGGGGAAGGPFAGDGGVPGGRGGKGGAAFGPVTRSVSYRNTGTQVQIIKPEIAPDGQVELQVQVEDAQMRNPSSGPEIGVDEKGAAVPAAEFTTTKLEERLRIPRGNIVVAQTTQANSRSGQGQKMILVGIRDD
jgi:hypothetical protein